MYSYYGEEGLSKIRNLFTYTTQESFFFEGSLQDNLLISNFEDKAEELEKLNKIRDYLLKFDLKNILERDFTLQQPLNLALDFYSGGEKKRLALIRSFVRDKGIEIYDEPTSYLDEKGSIKIINFLKERSREKIIIVSSHDQKLIDVADKVIDIGDLNHLISSIRKT